jgi:putative FmdB family regulatory protein
MPIYEYKCVCCNHELEIEQKISAPPLKDCPKCLVSALKRLIPGDTSFVLKGGGWYNDGYSSTKKEH